MKQFGALVILMAVLAASADARARDKNALIELHHEIEGPAWKVWSLRLEPNGQIIEETWDWSSDRYHSERPRCTLTQVASERALATSQQLLRSLPTTVDKGRPIPLDGPYKTLFVREGHEVRSSRWNMPEDSNPSVETRAFARAWEKIQALLTCD